MMGVVGPQPPSMGAVCFSCLGNVWPTRQQKQASLVHLNETRYSHLWGKQNDENYFFFSTSFNFSAAKSPFSGRVLLFQPCLLPTTVLQRNLHLPKQLPLDKSPGNP